LGFWHAKTRPGLAFTDPVALSVHGYPFHNNNLLLFVPGDSAAEKMYQETYFYDVAVPPSCFASKAQTPHRLSR
jgi:hypothetical protein